MAHWFNVGATTIQKYVDIRVDVIIDRDTMLNKYISVPIIEDLQQIINIFED